MKNKSWQTNTETDVEDLDLECPSSAISTTSSDFHSLRRSLFVTGGKKMVHLVYCDDKEKNLENILSGEKTMVVRGAMGRKIPHSRVFDGEILYFMKRGTAKITAKAKVDSVQNYVKLSDNEITNIFASNQERLKLSDKEKQRWHKKCLCLVGFKDIETVKPLDFEHQGNMDDWLIIEKIEDVVVGTSVPYNYDKSKFK